MNILNSTSWWCSRSGEMIILVRKAAVLIFWQYWLQGRSPVSASNIVVSTVENLLECPSLAPLISFLVLNTFVFQVTTQPLGILTTTEHLCISVISCSNYSLHCLMMYASAIFSAFFGLGLEFEELLRGTETSWNHETITY